jgi:hypothetical protein
VSVVFDDGGPRGSRIGHLEVHEGRAPMLATNRPYRLALENGRAEEIYITGLCQGKTDGVTTLAFWAPSNR